MSASRFCLSLPETDDAPDVLVSSVFLSS